MRRDLIVPIRDRRQSRRILTRRNVGIFLACCLVVFVGLTLFDNRRTIHEGEYGRLFGTQVASQPIAKPVPMVVTEGPVPEQTAPDPMLVTPAAREAILIDNTHGGTAPASGAGVSARMTTAPEAGGLKPAPTEITGRVAIVGGREGVAVVRGTAAAPKQPTLSGGIFRQ